MEIGNTWKYINLRQQLGGGLPLLFFENQEGLYHQQSDALCSIDLPYGNGTPESTGIKEV